jgi:uncharacterized protein
LPRFFSLREFMGKYLLLIVGAVVVYFLVRNNWRRRIRAQSDGKKPAEDMVRCVACGIHLPRNESLVVRNRYFCCAEHQRRHDAGQ